MTNKEKAKELAEQLLADDQNKQPLIDVLLQMAQWKEDDILNEICTWLANNAHKYVNSYGSVAYENYQLVGDLRNNLKIK